MNPRATGYCPGCLHGVATRLICELIDEFGIQERTTSVLPIGCSSMGVFHFDTDLVVSLHGRAPAVATGIKRCAPERFVYSYQGDGDLGCNGLSEIMPCSQSRRKYCAYIRKQQYLRYDRRTDGSYYTDRHEASTAPKGRIAEEHGYPMHMCEILNQLGAPTYLARVSCDSFPQRH